MGYLLRCGNMLLRNNSGNLLWRETIPESPEDCPCYPSLVWDILFEFDSGVPLPDYEFTLSLTNVTISYSIRMSSGSIQENNTSIELIERANVNCYLFDNVTQEIIPEPTMSSYDTVRALREEGRLVVSPSFIRFSKGAGYERPVNSYARFSAKHKSRITFSEIVTSAQLRDGLSWDISGIDNTICPGMEYTVKFTPVSVE